MYESLSRRAFGRLDTGWRCSLPRIPGGRAARGCERMLAKVGDRAGGDDAVLLARVQAEVALARGRPADAIAALRTVPEPWPAPLAAELLGLRARPSSSPDACSTA